MSYQRGEVLTGKDRQQPIGPQEMPITAEPFVPRPYMFEDEQLTIMPSQEPTMGTRFTVIDDFKSEELNCEYVAGMSYEARDEDSILLDLIPKWIADGKVREGGPASEVSGTAEVTDETK